MLAAAAIAALWVAFAATHMSFSSLRLRPRLVARMGEIGFTGFYSAVALLLFVPLVWIYFASKHAGPWLWGPVALSPLPRWILYVGMGAAFVLVAGGLIAPSPVSLGSRTREPRGLLRITRHPLNMGIALFALLHLVPNAALADVAFFGGFVAFALVGSWHQDQRKLATLPGYRAFHDRTPFLPFTGPGRLRGLREVSPFVVGVGIAVTVILRLYHDRLFG